MKNFGGLNQVQQMKTKQTVHPTPYTELLSIRPILIQLDFQSVENLPFQYVRMSFCPKMLEIGLPRLKMNQSDLSPRSIRSVLFDPIGWTIVIVFDPVRSKKC